MAWRRTGAVHFDFAEVTKKIGAEREIIMDIIESLRVELRNRIITQQEIIPPEQFQREFQEAPARTDFYVRETLLDFGRTEPTQTAVLLTVLCQYDIFVYEKWPNPSQTAYNLGAKLLEEFNVKDPAKANITLADWPNVQAWVREPPRYESTGKDETFYRLPVQIYIELLIRTDDKEQ